MTDDSARIQTRTDVMDPARVQALWATLDLPGQAPIQTLPPFFHQVFFWDAQSPGALGRDGHPRVGGLIPDMGLPRRMWAGGRLQFHAPLDAGKPAEKMTRVQKAERKQGRTGPLGFVTLRHDIHQDGRLAVTEFQDLVYREDPAPNAPSPIAPQSPDRAQSEEPVSFTSTQLFRYSALTFNGHRIHYDLDYCRDVEGYNGLVVHGPLLAQLLMLKATRELGPLSGFSFRATAPLVHSEAASLCRDGRSLWVRGPDGRLCMKAKATL
ncbi:MaoC family dehydratase N-terminal domain-containing protein [Aliiroseovarius subalbicans]|uniref:FAS1-like dehydratase domain-containing protein n=1 Tax=Aliiroseovarius subalbicans TaxID=2925840 RepID=UPI001F59CD38|nr:MaoC family dehydratase N-terminal domain-containing protein [Aliiroseovarius subalbicans]MCI2399751.1 MaoC family dehydratase N-terminal domain-containing protein [Aliiroseovarius subalbicans]